MHHTTTATSVLEELKSLGTAGIKKVLMNHGAEEPVYGVKVGDMKPIQKREKGNQNLAMELYRSGVSDAMYLAGLIADGARMSKAELQAWVKSAYWYMLSEYTVPWVTVESPFAEELAEEWIASPEESVAAAGWNTWAGLVSVRKDEALPVSRLRGLLRHVEEHIHTAPNRVRYGMNHFVICTGAYVKELSQDAVDAGTRIGEVQVNMGNTACKVPEAPAYIARAIEKGSLLKKKKTVKC